MCREGTFPPFDSVPNRRYLVPPISRPQRLKMAEHAAALLAGGAAGGELAAAAAASSSSSPGATSLGPAGAEGEPAAGRRGKGGGQGGASRKRVFTFQKRWQHALPIMERSLAASAVSGTAMKPRISEAAAVSTTEATTAGEAVDVVVCMVCDEPSSTKRDAPKIWSRLNCRRGRIENHLWSKHPEFMSLLKQKQEADGDLAVQIFLQSMRDGRCNVRNEIVTGLYAGLQTLSAGVKRGAEEPVGSQAGDDNDADPKRAKVTANDSEAVAAIATGMSPPMYSGGSLTRSAAHRVDDADGVYAMPPPAPLHDPALAATSSLASKVVRTIDRCWCHC